jgi:tRNA (cmo5U34)-methyltransferase
VASLFEDLDIGEAAYDLITSNMSLHHIADKLPFYRRLNSGLKPGGLFVFGDELQGISPLVEQANRNGWFEYARRTGHLSADEIADILRHEKEFDHYETLPRQLELLNEAGFRSADCVWRYLNYAVFVAEA